MNDNNESHDNKSNKKVHFDKIHSHVEEKERNAERFRQYKLQQIKDKQFNLSGWSTFGLIVVTVFGFYYYRKIFKK